MLSGKSIMERFAVLFAFFVIFAFTASAQITINIPKFPKIKKNTSRSEPSQPSGDNSSTNTSSDSALSNSNSNACTSPTVRANLEDIEKTRKEAEEYRPGLRDYYVSTLDDRKNRYFEAAMMPSKRKEWYANMPIDMQNCFDPALDALAAAAKKTLPSFTGPSGYTFGTPAEKKVLLTALYDIANGTVLRSGLEEANWLIEKNGYGLPTARFKRGYVLAKYANSDNTNCWLFWINIVQDYAGGGTYAASGGSFVSRSIAGCPAGK
jgi:hypothetical protein